MENFLDWTDKQIEDLVNRVYNGDISKNNIPLDLYDAIVAKLDEAILKEFQSGEVYDKFKQNARDFAFAKVFQQISDIENFLFDTNGVKIPFSEFKKSASQIFSIYNGTWLETEYNTAISTAQSASQWLEIQENKDVLPLLKYSTVGDGRVRNDHKTLDEIIRPVDDAFWSEHYPPNDFNCRCIVEQIEEGEITDGDALPKDSINPLFKNNPAETGEIFSKKEHPYFNGLGSKKNA